MIARSRALGPEKIAISNPPSYPGAVLRNLGSDVGLGSFIV
jgi:hypothetical protein